MTELLIVKSATGRQFDIVAVVDGKMVIVEGGFFSRQSAEHSRRALFAEQARDAERKAGWDPNP